MSWLDDYEELRLLCEKMGDEELEQALNRVIKCMQQPDQNPVQATRLIVELQALSAKFAATSVWYKTFGMDGKEERYKKDVYYTMKEAVNLLVDALKYSARLNKPKW